MKRNNSTVIVVVIMALISFMCLSLSVAYSYIYSSRSSGNIQSISTGNINAVIEFDPAAELTLEPLDDSDGINQESYGVINITKDNVYNVFYSLNIGYNTDFAASTYSSLVPMEYIKVALFDIVDGAVGSNPVVGPVRIADLPLFSIDTSHVNDLYSLAVGTLSAGNDSQKYAIKVWLDNDIPSSYNNYSVYLGVNIKQEPLINKGVYNISGLVYVDDVLVSGAEINLQNGLQKVTSGIDGSYTLTGVVEGTYNLKVTYNGAEYETTINVQSGSGIAVHDNSSSGIQGSSTSFIQKYAYDYFTTPYKIQKLNNLKSNSNENAGAYFTIPTSYIIQGNNVIGTSEIGEVKIQARASNLIISI